MAPTCQPRRTAGRPRLEEFAQAILAASDEGDGALLGLFEDPDGEAVDRLIRTHRRDTDRDLVLTPQATPTAATVCSLNRSAIMASACWMPRAG